MPSPHLDAVVVGAGPNGLAAAITLARAGRSVQVYEAAATVGGGSRSAALTLPGYVHDVCSAIHPLALASPFFQDLPQAALGLELAHPEVPYAHVLDGGRAVLARRSVAETASALGADGPAYRRLMEPLVEHSADLVADAVAPLHIPRHPVRMARFGLRALRSATGLTGRFSGEAAPALLAGVAAHSAMPLSASPTAAYALLLASLAHAVGWPTVVGGSQRIPDAMRSYLESLGGVVHTGRRVDTLAELPRARAVLLDVTPRQLLRIAGDRLPPAYRRRLSGYRYGAGVFKMDWALDGPVPWSAPEVAGAGTVHLGGSIAEIAESEHAVAQGRHPERPFLLLAQQSVFDPSRAPAGRHTAWAYSHVPNGSTEDMTGRVEAQVERFAPGFRDRVLARSSRDTAALERHNANCVGGDIAGGAPTLRQLFTRPVAARVPYATPVRGLYLCSSSTPPGAGVHGLCGWYAARAALRQVLGGSARRSST